MGKRAGLALAALLIATPAMAAPGPYDVAFVEAFIDACAPQRQSYEGTQQAALASGWAPVEITANPELEQMMQVSLAGAAAAEFEISYLFKIFTRKIEAADHYLVVSRTSASTDASGDPTVLVGCYLYNFDAAAPVDPDAVTAAFDSPIINQQIDMHVGAWLWGAPPSMPGTGDVYMTFLPEMSHYREETGFTGLVLKFSTSEPDAAATQ
jgi:hypothetical protein